MVVILAVEQELMNAQIAALQADVDRAYRRLIDARADLTAASAHSDAEVVSGPQ